MSKYFVALIAAAAYVASAADIVPVVCTTGTDFVGYDGSWSAVTIRVGNPEQWLSVLPTTRSQETWVMGPASCDGTSACSTARGGLFYSNESTTFDDLGFYELGHDGKSQFGYYGLDQISLNDNILATNQIVALLNTSDIWVGEIGLGVQQTRLNDTENRLPLLSSLVKNASIPSNSYGYTAGASYLLKGVPASLILGGVDTNRYTPNNLNLTLNSDYAPVVAVNSISVSTTSEQLPSAWDANPNSLLESANAATFVIDSSTPYLWMPPAVCERFADALGIYYNETLELYLYNATNSAEDLSTLNLTFTFEIGNLPGSEDNVALTVSFGAFNLQLSYGFPGFTGNFTSPPLSYFPLRKSRSETEYILGRAFLQETYLAVDYDRNSFSLSQAVITEQSTNNVNLAAITRPADSYFPGPDSESSKAGLSTAAKAGIGVGAGILIVLIVLLAWFLLKRRKHGIRVASISSEKPKRRSLFTRSPRSPGSNTTVSELLGDKRQPTELTADGSNSRFELPGNAPVEMAGPEVSPTFFQNPESRRDTGLRNDPRTPAELGQRREQTLDKEEEARADRSERSASPVPAYSPEQAQRLSDSVSPYSVRNSRGFGTVSSGETGISPVGNGSGRASDGFSNSIGSPVSPEATTRQFPGFFGSSEPSSTESSYGQHLTPEEPRRMPSRSPSQSSRFVEEGISDPVPRSNSTSRSARFSWED